MFVNGKLTVPPPLRDRLVFDNQLLLEFGEPDICISTMGRTIHGGFVDAEVF